uniref:Wsv250 n=1 Tax=White spot syndrome virus TaxID=92652 RepID=A0A2U9GEJ4_WSSV|nr:wsv250 [Shrimp white spot syndrome virus]
MSTARLILASSSFLFFSLVAATAMSTARLILASSSSLFFSSLFLFVDGCLGQLSVDCTLESSRASSSLFFSLMAATAMSTARLILASSSSLFFSLVAATAMSTARLILASSSSLFCFSLMAVNVLTATRFILASSSSLFYFSLMAVWLTLTLFPSSFFFGSLYLVLSCGHCRGTTYQDFAVYYF